MNLDGNLFFTLPEDYVAANHQSCALGECYQKSTALLSGGKESEI
jgi:hypothetical protein